MEEASNTTCALARLGEFMSAAWPGGCAASGKEQSRRKRGERHGATIDARVNGTIETWPDPHGFAYFDSRAFMIIETSWIVASPGSWYSPSVS